MKIEDLDSNFKKEELEGQSGYTDIRNTAAAVEGVFPGTWQRLPDDVLEEIDRETLTQLAYHTSGAVIRFKTDAPLLRLKMEVREPDFMMSHMPLTGSAGMDVFADGAYRATLRPELGDLFVEGQFRLSGEETEIAVYLPLYNGIKNFFVGIPEGGEIKMPDGHKMGTIVFYGSSITQGGCASKTSNSYAALTCRWLDAGMYCLGFSGNAKGDIEIARYIAGLPMECLIYDYDWNAPDAEFLRNTHDRFLGEILSENPGLPVLVMSRPNPEYYPDENESEERRKIVQETVQKYQWEGHKVEFLDGKELFGSESRECCTVDGIHPNDLGFYRMAQQVTERLRRLLTAE